MTRGFEFVSEAAKRAGAKLPTRATSGSAGYDFYAPSDIDIEPGETRAVYTGVKALFPKREVFLLFVRSSLAIKHGVMLKNGVGVIDSDYYGNAGNGGEIIGALVNTGNSAVHIKAGERFMQGIFVPIARANNDVVVDHAGRAGGVGSTGR